MQSIAPTSIISSFVRSVFASKKKTEDELLVVESCWPIVIDFIKKCDTPPTGVQIRNKLMDEGVVQTAAEGAQAVHWFTVNGYIRRQKYDTKNNKLGYVALKECFDISAHLNAPEGNVEDENSVTLEVAAERIKPAAKKSTTRKPAKVSENKSCHHARHPWRAPLNGVPKEAEGNVESVSGAEGLPKDHLLPNKVSWVRPSGENQIGYVMLFVPAGIDCRQALGSLLEKNRIVTVRDTPGYIVRYKGIIAFKPVSDVTPLSYFEESETSSATNGMVAAGKYNLALHQSEEGAPHLSNSQHCGATLPESFAEHLRLARQEGYESGNSLDRALLAKAESEIGFYEVQHNAIAMLLRSQLKVGALPFKRVKQPAAKSKPATKNKYRLPKRVSWKSSTGETIRGRVAFYAPANVDCRQFMVNKDFNRVASRHAEPGYLVWHKGRFTFKIASETTVIESYASEDCTEHPSGVVIAPWFNGKAEAVTGQGAETDLLEMVGSRSFIESLALVRGAAHRFDNELTEELLKKAEHEISFHEAQREAIAMLLRTRP